MPTPVINNLFKTQTVTENQTGIDKPEPGKDWWLVLLRLRGVNGGSDNTFDWSCTVYHTYGQPALFAAIKGLAGRSTTNVLARGATRVAASDPVRADVSLGTAQTGVIVETVWSDTPLEEHPFQRVTTVETMEEATSAANTALVADHLRPGASKVVYKVLSIAGNASGGTSQWSLATTDGTNSRQFYLGVTAALEMDLDLWPFPFISYRSNWLQIKATAAGAGNTTTARGIFQIFNSDELLP